MMALSLSLVTLVAGPALAQARRPTAEPQQIRTPDTTTLAAFTKPKFEFSLLGGYRWMAGSPLNLGGSSSSTFESNSVSTNPADAVQKSTSTTKNTSNATPSTTDMQTGFSVSGSATYWLDNSFGLGLHYTFVNTASKIDLFHTLALGTANTTTSTNPDTNPADGVTTGSNSVSSSIGFNNRSVSVSNAPTTRGALATSDYKEFNTTKANVSGFGLNWTFEKASEVGLGAGTTTFVNSVAIPETTAANAPTNTFTANGKIGGSREASTTMHMIDALTKTVIGASDRGELHLLAGVSVPMFTSRSINTSTIAGANGSGAATQTVVHADAATPDNNFTQVTSVEASDKTDNSSNSTMVGPMIGLGGTFKVSDALSLYGKFGYTPMMMGTSVSSSTSTTHQKISQTYTAAGTAAAAAGKVVGQEQTTENNSTTSSGDTNTSFVGGTASTFVIGARFNLTDSLGIVVEGVNQNVVNAGYAGVNAGVNLAF